MAEMRDAIASARFEAWEKSFHDRRAAGDIEQL